MDMKGKQAVREIIQKIGVTRLVILVLAGVMLLVLSLPSDATPYQEQEEQEESKNEGQEGSAMLRAMEQYARNQEKATEEILSQVEGIGKVKVMLTLASSEEKITLQDGNVTDEDISQSSQASGNRKDSKHQSSQESVLVKRDGTESPYVVQVQSPVVEGVVVVAQGVESSKKETEIIEAIQALFPVEAHKIKVMKME